MSEGIRESSLSFSDLKLLGSIKLKEIIDLRIEREVNKQTKAFIVGIIDENEKD